MVCEYSETLDGPHNRQNIAAAYAASIKNGITKEEFCSGLFSFKGLEHRQEFVARINGADYINDSKATNSQSVEQALSRFDNVHIILGGRMKENGIDSLVKYFGKIKRAFLIGEAAEPFRKILNEHNVWNKISYTIDQALKDSREFLKKDADVKVVLLSPACASFDQFSSFEERGDYFKKSVKAMETESE